MEKLTRVNWVMLVGGLLMVSSFFMPWMSFGPEKTATGIEVASHTRQAGGNYLLLYLLPALGLCIAFASLRSRKWSAGLGIATGLMVVGWALYEVFAYLSTSTHYGLWLSLAASFILLLGGIITGHWRNPPDEDPEPGVPAGAMSMGAGTLDVSLGKLGRAGPDETVAEAIVADDVGDPSS